MKNVRILTNFIIVSKVSFAISCLKISLKNILIEIPWKKNNQRPCTEPCCNEFICVGCTLFSMYFIHVQLGFAIRGIKLHNETVKMMDLSLRALPISMKLRAKYPTILREKTIKCKCFSFCCVFSPWTVSNKKPPKCKWKTFQATKNNTVIDNLQKCRMRILLAPI